MKNTKSTFIIFLLVCAISFEAFSQTKDSIYLTYRPVIGCVFKYQDKHLSAKQARQLMKAKPEAYSEMLKAKRNAFGQYLIAAGGVIIAMPILNNFIFKEKANVYPYIICGGILAASGIPFTNAYIKHIRKAVSLYNQNL